MFHSVESPSGAPRAPSAVLSISCVQQTGDHQTRTSEESLRSFISLVSTTATDRWEHLEHLVQRETLRLPD